MRVRLAAGGNGWLLCAAHPSGTAKAAQGIFIPLAILCGLAPILAIGAGYMSRLHAALSTLVLACLLGAQVGVPLHGGMHSMHCSCQLNRRQENW